MKPMDPQLYNRLAALVDELEESEPMISSVLAAAIGARVGGAEDRFAEHVAIFTRAEIAKYRSARDSRN